MIVPAQSFSDFQFASQSVLQFLHNRLGFGLWMVTRIEGDELIVLHAEDHGYGVSSGKVFSWLDSYCSRMIKGLGPRIAPCSNDFAAYLTAPIGQKVSIGAYIGVPIHDEDGSLFGTLCAIDPLPQPKQIEDELLLIELCASLLGAILHADLKTQAEGRLAGMADQEAITDSLTGLYNRGGWDRLLEAEEARCKRYGCPACVLSVDLNDLDKINDRLGHAQGDATLMNVAAVLQQATRNSDVVARLGGDEFAVLAVECDAAGAKALVKRIKRLLAERSITASIGLAYRSAKSTLQQTLVKADERMYTKKHQYHQCSPTDRQTQSAPEIPQSGTPFLNLARQ